jgi:hypothetical protein
MEFLDMEDAQPAELANWKNQLRRFVTMQMYYKRKGLVLKSPTHTGRLEVLAEMFPHAKFIHITRDPYQLFSSTQKLWTALDEAQGFQIPKEKDLDDYVLDCLERMYRGFEQQRPKIDPSRICDLRYEHLIQDPVGSLQKVYEQLHLGDFESVGARIGQSMENRKGHKINRHELPDEIRAEINGRWANYFEKYGYARV